MSFEDYLAFKARHPKKLLVIISQAEGTRPSGRTAVSVMFDASLKIWVEGYRAISKGRYFGDKGYYTIWAERAEEDLDRQRQEAMSKDMNDYRAG